MANADMLRARGEALVARLLMLTTHDCDYEAHPDGRDEDGEALDLDTLFWMDSLGVEFTVDEHLDYRSVRICLAYGGPNVYVDTGSGDVELSWGFDTVAVRIPWATVGAIDDWAEAVYEDRRGSRR